MAPRLHTLFIGYGNSLRRDDGAGLILAKNLAEHWRRQGRYVRCLIVHQLTPDLAFDITAEDVGNVVFVDAVMTTRDTTESDLTIHIDRLAESGRASGVGHHMDAGELMVYGQLLYRRRPPAWIVTVPGLDFAHGEGLSRPVRRLVEDVDHVARRLEHCLGLKPAAQGDSPPSPGRGRH